MKASALTILLVLAPLPTVAGDLMIYYDTDFTLRSNKCLTGGDAVGVHLVYVPSFPGGDAEQISSIQFRLPIPACVTVASRVDVPVWNTVGSSETGVTIVPDLCSGAPIHLLTVYLIYVSVLQGCCPLTPDDVVALDCGGSEIPVNTIPSYFNYVACDFITPNSPSPMDGSTLTTLDPLLEWVAEWKVPACDLGDVGTHNVYVGTDPGNLTKYSDIGSPSWQLTGLISDVIYYWQAELTTVNGAGPYLSPLWSFRPLEAQPVTPTSWGRIKALYR